MPSCAFIQGGSEGGSDIFYDKPQAPLINQALVAFEALPEGFSWYGWTGECYNCRLEELPSAVPGWEGSSNSSCAIVSATFPYELQVRNTASNEVVHKASFTLRQRGGYLFSAPLDASAGSCCEAPKMSTTHDGVAMSEIWGPFAALFAAIAATAFAIWWVGGCRHPDAAAQNKEKTSDAELYSKLAGKTNDVESAAASSAKPAARTARLESLDTFRGMSLSVMIFVNYGGGGYWWLDHSSWDGLTVADLLFPWFMWIMGVSMSLALKSRKSAKISRTEMLIQVVRRSATLAAIGLFLDAPATLGRWRFPGVLQYFGFSYLWCAGTVVLTGSWDGEAGQQAQAALEAQQLNSAAPGGGEGFPYDTFLDLRFFWREWVGIGVAPLMWLVLTFGVHVPGCGYGYLGPGGRSLSGSGGGGGDDDDDSFAACTGGSHRYIDMQFFGSKHLYDEPTCSVAYECNTPYDPEGLVGGFNAVLLTYLGLVAGRALIYHSSSKARMARLGVQGLLWLTIGAALCGFSQHGGAIPVNKNLWSLSFVLVTAGFGCWVLAVLYWIVDHAKLWSGAPFKYTGMNSIVVYAGSEILEMYFPFHVGGTSKYDHWGHLFANAWGAGMWNAVATYLFFKKTFIKI